MKACIEPSKPKRPDPRLTPVALNSANSIVSAMSLTSSARTRHSISKPRLLSMQPLHAQMPTKIPPLEYPDRFEVRYVSANGGIRWNKQWVNVSTVCAGEHVGLEEIDDGIWNVYFGPPKLGRLLERHMRTEDAFGRMKRKNV